jgi:double-strand break repair protein MRE11
VRFFGQAPTYTANATRGLHLRKVGILSVQRGQFNIETIPLKTVRPFKIGEVVLEDEADDENNHLDLQKRETITAFLKTKVGPHHI